MLSATVLKQFRTYLKSQVGQGWSVEGRKSKGRLRIIDTSKGGRPPWKYGPKTFLHKLK